VYSGMAPVNPNYKSVSATSSYTANLSGPPAFALTPPYLLPCSSTTTYLLYAWRHPPRLHGRLPCPRDGSLILALLAAVWRSRCHAPRRGTGVPRAPSSCGLGESSVFACLLRVGAWRSPSSTTSPSPRRLSPWHGRRRCVTPRCGMVSYGDGSQTLQHGQMRWWVALLRSVVGSRGGSSSWRGADPLSSCEL
jgi:hypothetical protein